MASTWHPWKSPNRKGTLPSIQLHLGVSKNSGTPKSSIFIRFSIINHPFWGTSIFGSTPIFGASIHVNLPRRSQQRLATAKTKQLSVSTVENTTNSQPTERSLHLSSRSWRWTWDLHEMMLPTRSKMEVETLKYLGLLGYWAVFLYHPYLFAWLSAWMLGISSSIDEPYTTGIVWTERANGFQVWGGKNKWFGSTPPGPQDAILANESV